MAIRLVAFYRLVWRGPALVVAVGVATSRVSAHCGAKVSRSTASVAVWPAGGGVRTVPPLQEDWAWAGVEGAP